MTTVLSFPAFVVMQFYSLNHHIGQSLSLQCPGEEAPRWTFDYASAPKPFFHPIRTPRGHVVTINGPHDHVWHHGLWFTLKYINGINFWEEEPSKGGPFGTQRVATPPSVEHGSQGEITLTLALDWNVEEKRFFVEKRVLIYRPLDELSYALDFDIQLQPETDIELNRTPFGEFGEYGGYAGLTLRGNRNWQKTRILFADGSTSERPLGYGANWADLSGIFDGGTQQWGGLALFDHPDNPRYPSPWYGKTGDGHYLNAAFLFHEPMLLSAGQPLRLRYRALVHDELLDQAQLNAAYKRYLHE